MSDDDEGERAESDTSFTGKYKRLQTEDYDASFLSSQIHHEGENSSSRFSLRNAASRIGSYVQHHKSKFYGWRMGILLGVCAASFIFCCDVSLVIKSQPKLIGTLR